MMRYTARWGMILVLALISCGRIKHKGQQIAERTKQKIENKSNELADKIAPHFDAYKPDTKFNKERFLDFLQVDLTPDVRNIYCYDDAIGIDADYQFAFDCDTATVRRIIEKHGLVRASETSDDGFGLQNDFDWWDKKKIEQLDLYSREGSHQHFQYFWYDQKEQKAYYFDFDL